MDEIARPRLHAWIDESIKEGKFGEPDVGFETLVAGGMHSIAVSPDGKVCVVPLPLAFFHGMS